MKVHIHADTDAIRAGDMEHVRGVAADIERLREIMAGDLETIVQEKGLSRPPAMSHFASWGDLSEVAEDIERELERQREEEQRC